MSTIEVDDSGLQYLFDLERKKFEQGEKQAWIVAFLIARQANAPPPEWAWRFVADGIDAFLYGAEESLQAALHVKPEGKKGSRRIKNATYIYFGAAQDLLAKEPGRPRNERFWDEAAVLAHERGAPPIGAEKIRKIYAEAMATIKQIDGVIARGNAELARKK